MDTELEPFSEVMEPSVRRALASPRFHAFLEETGRLASYEQQYILDKQMLNSAEARKIYAEMDACKKQSEFYRLLGLDTHEGVLFKHNVRNAYRRAARLVHPDKGGTHEQMIALQDAYHHVLKTVPKGE